MLMTTRGSYRIDLQGWPNLTNPKVILLARDTAVPLRSHNVVSDLTEYTGSGYDGGFGGTTRETPANLAVSEDDGNVRSEMTHDPVTVSGVLGPDPIAPISALIEEITDDAGSHVIAFSPIKTAGNEIAVTAASEANPAVLTTASAHGLATNDLVYIEGAAGGTWPTQLNGRVFKVTVVDADEFSLQGVDSSSFGTATFATFKVYRPIPMNGADLTLTPDAQGVAQSYPQDAAVTS